MGWLQWILGWFGKPKPKPKPEPPPPQPPPAGLPRVEELVAAINDARERRVFPALATNAILMDRAQQWAWAMATANRLSHDGFPGRIADVFPGTPDGEVVAWNQTTVQQVVADWMRSPGHREVLLGDFDQIGAGVARAADGSLYWCVDVDLSMLRSVGVE